MPSTRPPKGKKQHDKLKKKEYSRSYLEKKREREELPNEYPKTRMILIKDFFRTPDLYKAIIFFLMTQVVIITIAAGVNNPEIAGALNLIALAIGIILVICAIITINRRQRNDDTRRPFKIGTVLGILILMYIAVVISSWVFSLLGIQMTEQPNQSSIDDLAVQFPLAMLFTVIIVSPFIEELVFRELLPYATGPSYLSFIISSVIFIALHAPFGIMGWTSYAILAGGFLFARLKDNNVYTAIAVHMVWNAMSILL